MEAYTGFAKVYDLFMDNIPYEEWSRRIVGILKQYGISDGLVLDLGCGTGSMTELLANAGYDMIGLDASEEMLNLAVQKRAESGLDILYLLQDMRELELYGTVRAVVSVCDSINYVTEEADLLQVFRLVNNYLDPGGIFLFDLNTVYKYETFLGENTIAENRREGSFIWENYFDAGEGLNEYSLTLFIREEGGLYRKYEETHYQRAYSLERVRELLEEAGLEVLGFFDAETGLAPEKTAERIYAAAREQGKRSV
ncbi:MAG: class I SAM-dependent methyltransferase [Lachnospiraceae bacterium]|nr:class I SAM-dependent methyltransferase [Lachnospiraceae bacterium]